MSRDYLLLSDGAPDCWIAFPYNSWKHKVERLILLKHGILLFALESERPWLLAKSFLNAALKINPKCREDPDPRGGVSSAPRSRFVLCCPQAPFHILSICPSVWSDCHKTDMLLNSRWGRESCRKLGNICFTHAYVHSLQSCQLHWWKFQLPLIGGTPPVGLESYGTSSQLALAARSVFKFVWVTWTDCVAINGDVLACWCVPDLRTHTKEYF